MQRLEFARVERVRDVEVPAELQAADRAESLRQDRVRQGDDVVQVQHREGRVAVQHRYRFGVDPTARHQQGQQTPAPVVLVHQVVVRPAVEIASAHGDAPAAVGPRPRVVRIPAADVAEAGAEVHDVRDDGDEGVPVDEVADLGRETVEDGGLELQEGRGWCFWEGARIGWGREGTGSDCGQGSGLGLGLGLGLGFGCDAAVLRFSRPGLEDLTGDAAEEAEEVESRPAQDIQEVLNGLVETAEHVDITR